MKAVFHANPMRKTMTDSHPLSRRLPRPRELRPLLGFRPPALGTQARVRAAATVSDLRRMARTRVPRAVFDYVDGGAEAELSMRRARQALARVEWRPRILRDVASTDPGTRILGRPAAMPLALGPTGFTRMMHYQGEFAVGAAAAAAGLPYALSTMGTVTPEQLAAAEPGLDRWFQLYLWRDREASKRLLDRAAASGFRTLVLTVDTPVAGQRLRDVRNGLSIPPTLSVRTFLDMSRHPRWWANLLTTEPLTFASLSSTDGTVAAAVDRVFDPSASFADLDWLRGSWDGPILIKGIQTTADAQQCLAAGADGVIVSNHGGRQLDRAPVALEMLGEIRSALGPGATVLVDGGFYRGSDIAAAVALGADAVLIGRAYLYGLMAGGRPGVERVLQILREEFERTCKLLGVGDVAGLRGTAVLRPDSR